MAHFAATAIPAWHDLPMEQDDPEKRIAELERQLGEARAAGAAGTPQASPPPPAGTSFPPARTPFPAPPAAAQPFPPPPVGWQSPPQMGLPPYSFPAASGRNRGARTAIILMTVGLPILIIVIVGIVVMPYLHQAANPFSTKGPSQASAGSTQLLTPDGLSGLLTQIRSKFGDTMGFSLTVYPDYANLDRADPQNSQHKQSYLYKNGSWNEFGETEHVSTLDSLVDLGKFDPAAVAAKISGAAQPLNVPNPTSTYLIVEGSDGGGTRIGIYASGNGDSGYMDVNPDGTVKDMHPQT
jgi:hypothetical protein